MPPTAPSAGEVLFRLKNHPVMMLSAFKGESCLRPSLGLRRHDKKEHLEERPAEDASMTCVQISLS